MLDRKEVWTILLVTAVSVLIWFWAAGETVDQRKIEARVTFKLPEPQSWLISPRQQFVSITFEGSKLALQKADQILRRGLELPLTATVGRQQVDMVVALRSLRELADTGVKILGVEPASIDVDVDAIVRVPTRVRPAMPGVQTVGEIEISPAEVTLAMPGALRLRYPGDLPVEAFIDRTRLDALEPGQRHTLDVRLRAPEGLAMADGVRIEPATARVTFTVRSRTRELKLESVRVQLAGPPEDHREYIIEMDDRVLRNVTITAESDLIRRIESDEVTVVAMLHLSNREKEQGFERKAITYFLALVPDNAGGTRGVIVEGAVEGSEAMPEVGFSIRRRAAPIGTPTP